MARSPSAPSAAACVRRAPTRSSRVWPSPSASTTLRSPDGDHGDDRDVLMDLGIFDAVWYANLTKLWRDFGALPIRFARDFDEARQRGIAIAGTPARVREEIERQVAASTCTYIVVRLMFGQMTETEASASIGLFTTEVMPHLAKLTAS